MAISWLTFSHLQHSTSLPSSGKREELTSSQVTCRPTSVEGQTWVGYIRVGDKPPKRRALRLCFSMRMKPRALLLGGLPTYSVNLPRFDTKPHTWNTPLISLPFMTFGNTYSVSQPLWYISRIILNIFKTVTAFLTTIQGTIQWITC